MLGLLPGLVSCLEGGLALPQVVRVSGLATAACDPDIFRDLYRAMVNREAVSIDYRAKSGPMLMWFSPHSLVETSSRLHFRGNVSWIGRGDPDAPREAYSYRDIVPSRIALTQGFDADAYISSDGDLEWNTLEDLVFLLSSELPEPLHETIIQEWGTDLRKTSDGFILTLPAIRRAMAQYVRDALNWRAFQGEIFRIWIPVD
jgi:hypothetical protein